MAANRILRRSLAEQELSSCKQISQGFHIALANTSVFILHRSQWQCLALSYTEVLQALRRLLPQDLLVPRLLCVLREVMLEAKRFMGHCTTTHPVGPSWLLNTALTHGAVTDVTDIHLDRFLWAFSTILLGAAPILRQFNQVKPELILLTKALAKIWDGEHAKNDLSSICDFLAAIECQVEGDTFSLAEFIQRRLSHHRQEPVSGPSPELPAYFLIDPESMQKDPEVLGSGASGNVHKAKWLGGHFAVKDIFYVENNERSRREAFIQAQLTHPNVLPLLCYTEIPSLNKCCLVMELMKKDLRGLILDRKRAGRDPVFSHLVALELMLQIAQGMEYLHSLHIMHRDLKSLNVLVSFPRENDNLDPSFTHLKVADFGGANAKNASTAYTTKPLGTLWWRAPEMFKQDSEGKDVTGVKYRKSADVYSFGMVCYEILTGNFPFDGKTNICKRVLKGERPALPPTCPRALSSLIKSCWNAEPSKRPSFSQICNVLRYLKASVLLQNDQCGSSASSCAYSHCLSQTLGLEFCNDIDSEFLSSMHREGIVFQPRALNIPLRMYCCEIVIRRGLKSGLKSLGFSWIQKLLV